jgi:hypothetical protein
MALAPQLALDSNTCARYQFCPWKKRASLRTPHLCRHFQGPHDRRMKDSNRRCASLPRDSPSVPIPREAPLRIATRYPSPRCRQLRARPYPCRRAQDRAQSRVPGAPEQGEESEVAPPAGAARGTQIAAAMLAMVAKNLAVEVVVAAGLPAEGFARAIVPLAPAMFVVGIRAQSGSTPR